MNKVPYSLRSFKALAERESRRGKDISRYVPLIKSANDDLRRLRKNYETNIAALKSKNTRRSEIADNYRKDRDDLRKKRDKILEESLLDTLAKFELSLKQGTFSLGLKPAAKVGKHQTYRVAEDLAVIFPARQAAAVVKKLHKAQSQSRNSIVRALKDSLRRSYQHSIYRLDIQNYFDSIPHDKLLERLEARPHFDRTTDHVVLTLLNEYAAVKGERIGVPRGVGISSQLGDFYLDDFDHHIKTQRGLLFYARYVDDIILVLDDDKTLDSVKNSISQALQELGLQINQEKTQEISTDEYGNYDENEAIEYLGYRFTRANKKLKTGLTQKRLDRRVARLETAFETWLICSPRKSSPNSGHDGLLLDRIRYLTGNTKLLNSKDNVAIGLYFSNSALDEDAKELLELDQRLSDLVARHSDKMSDRLLERLQLQSFVEMYRQRPFHRFKQKRVEQIIQCWREHRA